MSEVMAFRASEEDFGEELTSFRSEEDEEDKDDDEVDMDDDDDEDDEDMYLLYDEQPSYLMLARLKELNDALRKEIIPPGYEDRNRKVRFLENPIYMEIFTPNSDDEGEEGAVDDDEDDGYGDSTEVSDELSEENNGSGHKTNGAEAKPSEEADESKPTDDSSTEEATTVVSSEENNAQSSVTRSSEDIVDSSLNKIENVTLPLIDDVVENTPVIITKTESESIESLKVEETSVCSVELGKTDDELKPEVTTDSSSTQNSQVEEEAVNKSDEVTICNQNGNVEPSKPTTKPPSRAQTAKSRERNGKVAAKQTEQKRQRSSSVPPRGSKGDSTMIMASKGKFHMMTTDDIQVKRASSSTSFRSSVKLTSAPLSTQKTTSSVKATMTPSSVTSASSRKSAAIPSLESKTCKLNSRNSRPQTTSEAKVKSVPKELPVSTTAKSSTSMPKYSGGGPSKYGLTKEQKNEKTLFRTTTIHNIQEKKQESAAEIARKREQKDEAYRMWLQRKKLAQKTAKQNDSASVENGKSEQPKTHKGPHFDEWLMMKRKQKKTEMEMERMKKKVEMEISYVKTSEQNRRDFNNWSKLKKHEAVC